LADPNLSAPEGIWEGSLDDPQTSFEARLILSGCAALNEPCGEIEYMDPAQPTTVLCAPELIYHGTEGESFIFEERPAYRPNECFPTTLKMHYGEDYTLAVDQYVEPEVVCCTGTFRLVSQGATPPSTLPAGASIDGLEGPLSVTDLHGPTTQYSASSADSMWFPVPGAVHRLDPNTGEITSTISVGDPKSDFEDPHGVAAEGDTIWVAQLGARSVVRIDPDTEQIVQTVDLDVAPYALALDGTDLWLSSFHDNAVVRVDTLLGEATTRIDVDFPTGIATGGGAVWVVGHRSDSLMRIDPAAGEIVATIKLGESGDSPTCGMCVENVVLAFGSAWTANNTGRSITRVDAATNEAVEIPVESRVWAVAAAGEAIWASQFEELDEMHIDLEAGGLAELDPATNAVTQFDLPGTLGVASGHDSLWPVALGRRSDLVYRYAFP
jgi:streptogramin lyase